MVVNGSVDAGVLNQKILEINSDGSIGTQSTGITFDTSRTVTLGDVIQDRVDQLVKLAHYYVGTDLFDIYYDEILFWEQVSLGLNPNASFVGDFASGVYVISGIDELVKVLNPISARGGNIIVEADNLFGQGGERSDHGRFARSAFPADDYQFVHAASLPTASTDFSNPANIDSYSGKASEAITPRE